MTEIKNTSKKTWKIRNYFYFVASFFFQNIKIWGKLLGKSKEILKNVV